MPCTGNCQITSAAGMSVCHTCGWDDWFGFPSSPKNHQMELEYAKQLANNIVKQLHPFTDRIHIAGSIRRKASEVKDIEIICLPQKEPRQGQLFSDIQVTSKRFKDCVRKIMYQGVRGLPEGHYMQFILAADRRMKVDLFMPREEDYYRILAIRTGSTEYAHKVIAGSWLKKGWCGVAGEGLHLQTDCVKSSSGNWVLVNKHGQKPPAWQSEEEFFKWINVPFVQPEQREVVSKHLSH